VRVSGARHKNLGFRQPIRQRQKKIVAHGLVFALGVLLSFWTLAGVLAVLRSGGAQLGWGFQLQSPAFVFRSRADALVFRDEHERVFEFGSADRGRRGTAVKSQPSCAPPERSTASTPASVQNESSTPEREHEPVRDDFLFVRCRIG